jgi:hypothetical protein
MSLQVTKVCGYAFFGFAVLATYNAIILDIGQADIHET